MTLVLKVKIWLLTQLLTHSLTHKTLKGPDNARRSFVAAAAKHEAQREEWERIDKGQKDSKMNEGTRQFDGYMSK